jgi:hypothetical protein
MLVAVLAQAACTQPHLLLPTHDRYDEAGAAATRIAELRAAEAGRLKGLLASAHQAELAQIQGNFQQVSVCVCEGRCSSLLVLAVCHGLGWQDQPQKPSHMCG